MLILLDQDGVLADFDAAFCMAWTQQGHAWPVVTPDQRKAFYVREDYPEAWRSKVDAIYTTPGFFLNLPPLPGALEGVAQMLAEGHDVRICTSPLNAYEHCVLEKYRWIERHLGAAMVQRMMVTKDKTLVHGDVLIDDKPKISGARTPTWQHVVLDQPYNRDAQGPRMRWTDWRSVLAGLG